MKMKFLVKIHFSENSILWKLLGSRVKVVSESVQSFDFEKILLEVR